MRLDTPKVLIVEDHLHSAQAMAVLFRLWGWKTTKAFTVAEAVVRLAEPFDLVVLDLQLPDGSGADVLKAARAREGRTPVVVTTANTDAARDAASLGLADADLVLTKPYLFEQLADFAAGLHAKFQAGK